LFRNVLANPCSRVVIAAHKISGVCIQAEKSNSQCKLPLPVAGCKLSGNFFKHITMQDQMPHSLLNYYYETMQRNALKFLSYIHACKLVHPTARRYYLVGNGTGPDTRAPVDFAAASICSHDCFIRFVLYDFNLIRIFCWAGACAASGSATADAEHTIGHLLPKVSIVGLLKILLSTDTRETPIRFLADNATSCTTKGRGLVQEDWCTACIMQLEAIVLAIALQLMQQNAAGSRLDEAARRRPRCGTVATTSTASVDNLSTGC
jgi:hypothetical protein